jgi:hypothetical protein
MVKTRVKDKELENVWTKLRTNVEDKGDDQRDDQGENKG